MATVPIVPAIIPRDQTEVVEMTKTLAFSHELHLDVVDGVFVSAVCWPFSPKGEEVAVKPFTDRFTLEVDLMVQKPIEAAREWIKAGADMLVFHIETIDLVSLVDFILYAPKGVSIGVSFHGDTSIESFLPYVAHADYVQLMGIHTIGSQGQPFDERVFKKIERIKKEFPHKTISVDGSVNKASVEKLVKAGVDRLIVGSAIVKQPDPALAYQELNTLIKDL